MLDRIEVNMSVTLRSCRVARIIILGMAIATVILGLAGPAPGKARPQSGVASTQSPATSPQSFEVASIKPSDPQPAGFFKIGTQTSPGGRFSATGITAKMLIQRAYDLRDYQVLGGPGWITTERYDIVAKAETPDISREQLKILLQSLLAERFNLKISRETKELPIYVLVVGKNGPKLKKSEIKPDSEIDAQPPKSGDPAKIPVLKMLGPGGASVIVAGGGVAGAGGATGGGGDIIKGSGSVSVTAGAGGGQGGWMRMGPGSLIAQDSAISTLTMLLSQLLGRPVLDKTGIEGKYDFSLEYTPDDSIRSAGMGGIDKPDLVPADPSGPSIFTALQDQLGLKLEAQKGPVETLVIIGVDKSSKN
jgi:uncharacterized protein (TIGR03435 family)